MIAPSVGNIHGRYTSPPNFRIDLLTELQKRVGPKTQANAHIVLHGTDDLPDELFRQCVQSGCVKINVNGWAREPQVDHWWVISSSLLFGSSLFSFNTDNSIEKGCNTLPRTHCQTSTMPAWTSSKPPAHAF